VKEIVGKGTGTGRVISEGLAKADDPIWTEGWSIHIGPFSGQSSDAPSSTSDEAGEFENVVRNPMSGEEIRCHYCNSAEVCPHMLFLINSDCPGNVEGYCANRFGEFRELIETDFLDRLQSGNGSDWSWNSRELNELWWYARISFSVGDTTVALDGVVVANLVINMFDRVGGEKYSRSVENAPGPGLASVWTLYYAKNPAAVFDAALLELKKLLVPEVKEAVKTRRSKRKGKTQMKEEQNNTSEKPLRFPSGREVTPAIEAIVEQHLREHPGLTREQVLEEMEYAGF
jgi:hypothetical protein